MYKICVFAGTTEGRELVEFLSAQPIAVTACLATEYGEALLPPAENLTVSARPLSAEEIRRLLAKEGFDLLIDATHPYAKSVTAAIVAACRESGTEYLRLLRRASALPADAVFCQDLPAAVEFLDRTEGSILLTTGSKELPAFAAIRDFPTRAYARVLPLESSLAACREAGLPPTHIFAMQGPFSEEMNLAMLRASGAEWLLSKDGGDAGGLAEKAAAAEKAGVRLLVIGRPPQEEGVSFAEAVDELCRRFGCQRRPQVHVLGIGPGNRAAMTQEVRRAIENADCLIGAGRMLEAVSRPGQDRHAAIAPQAIAEYISAHPEHQRFAVLMSGDVGFFSGSKKLLPLLAGCRVELLPGLSSLAYLCARLQCSYEDVVPVSLHGREHDIVPDVRANRRVFVLVGGENGMQELCRQLSAAGLGGLQLAIGERLSYPDEKISRGSAAELAEGTYAPLSVALIENEHPDAVCTPGLPDEAFRRGESESGRIPMSKSELRAVCLSKLRLHAHAVCWDVGAGTGSVAIEMALQARHGQVYAIEQKEAAVALITENRAAFGLENLTPVLGEAPAACRELPAPTHAFIGGSSGKMREIIALLLEKNPAVRIVATAISLESIAELSACLKEFPFTEQEVVSLQVARSKKAGAYQLMCAQNPIYVFTMQAGGPSS